MKEQKADYPYEKKRMKFKMDAHIGLGVRYNRGSVSRCYDSMRSDFVISLLITDPKKKSQRNLDCECPKGQRTYSTWYPGT